MYFKIIHQGRIMLCRKRGTNVTRCPMVWLRKLYCCRLLRKQSRIIFKLFLNCIPRLAERCLSYSNFYFIIRRFQKLLLSLYLYICKRPSRKQLEGTHARRPTDLKKIFQVTLIEKFWNLRPLRGKSTGNTVNFITRLEKFKTRNSTSRSKM